MTKIFVVEFFSLSLCDCTKDKKYIQPWGNSECVSRKEINGYAPNSFPSIIFRSFCNSSLLKKGKNMIKKNESRKKHG